MHSASNLFCVQPKMHFKINCMSSYTYIFFIVFSSCSRGVLVRRWGCHPLGGPTCRGPGAGCHSSSGRRCRGSSSACWGSPHCATSGWATSCHTPPGSSTARGHSPTPEWKHHHVNTALLSGWINVFINTVQMSLTQNTKIHLSPKKEF